MELLQIVNSGAMQLNGGDAFNRGLCGGDGRDGGYPSQNGRTADSLLVKKRILPARGVDDELDAVALDQVDDVGPAFLHLEYPLDGKA